MLLDKVEDINKELVEFFSDLLTKDPSLNTLQQDQLLEDIPSVISDSQNQALCRPILIEENRQVVFSMVGDKALGLDGFPAFFYQ